MRVFLTKSNANPTTQTQVIAVDFDHTKTTGGTAIPGIQDLTGFVAAGSATITSAPALTTATGDMWTYTFTVSMTGAAGITGEVDFTARMAAGAHRNTGSSLAIGGTPNSMGNVQIAK